MAIVRDISGNATAALIPVGPDKSFCTYNRKVTVAAFATIDLITPQFAGERVLHVPASGPSLLYQALDLTGGGWQLCTLNKDSGA